MISLTLKRLLAFFILISFTVAGAGCLDIPLFKYPLDSVSDKAAKDLVKSSWISVGEDRRLVLSFVRKYDGTYTTVFRKSEFVDGKLKQENMLLPGRVCKAGEKRLLFLEALDPEKKSSSTEEEGYMVFYFEINGDILNLHLLKSQGLIKLVKDGFLQGVITESQWKKDVKIESQAKSLEKVLSAMSLKELIGDQSKSNKAKSFKRKN